MKSYKVVHLYLLRLVPYKGQRVRWISVSAVIAVFRMTDHGWLHVRWARSQISIASAIETYLIAR